MTYYSRLALRNMDTVQIGLLACLDYHHHHHHFICREERQQTAFIMCIFMTIRHEFLPMCTTLC